MDVPKELGQKLRFATDVLTPEALAEIIGQSVKPEALRKVVTILSEKQSRCS